MDLDSILQELADKGGSDLHVKVNRPPLFRISGDLLPRTSSLSAGDSLCSFCEVAAVCGPGHRRIYDAKREAERAGRPGQPLFVLEEVP